MPDITFESEKAAPYRSYLALYFWEMLDLRQLVKLSLFTIHSLKPQQR
jgi:hypothetical protein